MPQALNSGTVVVAIFKHVKGFMAAVSNTRVRRKRKLCFGHISLISYLQHPLPGFLIR
jgi:hypothetical protein